MGTFGQRLRELRNSRGISQNELSKHIGVSKSSVNMYERDEREPGFETLEAIADFFNVDMNTLTGYAPLDEHVKLENGDTQWYLDEIQRQSEKIDRLERSIRRFEDLDKKFLVAAWNLIDQMRDLMFLPPIEHKDNDVSIYLGYLCEYIQLYSKTYLNQAPPKEREVFEQRYMSLVAELSKISSEMLKNFNS